MSSPVSNSISNSISKYSIDEEIEVKQESISNEKIVNGTELLGMYKVTSDAIRGGMGSVWRVHHKDWNVDLAMKRPLPRFFAEGSEKRKENFIRECESWINLGMHPNIVSCYYVREIGGVPTIFSEWMENGSLENRIRDGSLYQGTEEEKQARLLDIAIQFSRGLHYAHENGGGMIHQDVKPANLLLTNEYEAKVADFGLARIVQMSSYWGKSSLAVRIFTAGRSPCWRCIWGNAPGRTARKQDRIAACIFRSAVNLCRKLFADCWRSA